MNDADDLRTSINPSVLGSRTYRKDELADEAARSHIELRDLKAALIAEVNRVVSAGEVCEQAWDWLEGLGFDLRRPEERVIVRIPMEVTFTATAKTGSLDGLDDEGIAKFARDSIRNHPMDIELDNDWETDMAEDVDVAMFGVDGGEPVLVERVSES